MNGSLLNQVPTYEYLLNAKVQLQIGEEMSIGKVKHWALGPDGMTSGKYDNNPYLNLMIYEVEFTDRQVKEYGANIIAKNMLTQVDSDSFSLALMECMINHTKDEAIAVPMEDKYLLIQSRQ